MSQLAKISSKGQVTVPTDVRKALHLETGDTLAWDIEADGRIFVRRLEPIDLDYLTAVSGTLSEWNSSEDDEAYRDL
jgi:AbrB family looped-hinge helix DNA binding protein